MESTNITLKDVQNQKHDMINTEADLSDCMSDDVENQEREHTDTKRQDMSEVQPKKVSFQRGCDRKINECSKTREKTQVNYKDMVRFA